MKPELRKTLIGQIDRALKDNPKADCDASFAAAGHVEGKDPHVNLTNWRRLFFERRAALTKPPAPKSEPAPPAPPADPAESTEATEPKANK